MSELHAETSGDVVTITFDESLYPKDAIYGASYIFIDRCYVHLDRSGDGKISVALRRKAHVTLQLEALAGEFENELLGQAWRRMITDENRELIQQVTTMALGGAAGAPGLDDLLTFESDANAFEDPLGIAMSWEDKYKKKAPAATDGAPEPPAAASASDEKNEEPKAEGGS
ncbi:MAG: His-Xaa-Ser system protein HxsD [Polyangiaceae bacterium]